MRFIKLDEEEHLGQTSQLWTWYFMKIGYNNVYSLIIQVKVCIRQPTFCKEINNKKNQSVFSINPSIKQR